VAPPADRRRRAQGADGRRGAPARRARVHRGGHRGRVRGPAAGSRRPERVAMSGRAGRTLVIFGWHSVGPTWFTPSPRRRALRGLERQLRGLRAGFTVVPLGEAVERLEAGGRLPRRAAAITFDDGYRDNLELAVPVLRRLGL